MAGGSAIEGYWLPGLATSKLELEQREFGPGRLRLLVPRLTAGDIEQACDALRAGRRTLLERPVAEIIAGIAAAGAKLTLPGSSFYELLVGVLPDLTGYSRQMIEIGLERMGAGWTAEALHAALDDELGDSAVLDGFVPKKAGGLHRAFGPELAVHFFSGNIPGVAVTSLIRTLCVKAPSLGKTAAGEPYFAVCFARALAEVDAQLAGCIGVTYWPGGDEELEDAALGKAEAIIAYGGDAAIAEIRRRIPEGVRFLAYPNRVGAAIVARSALVEATGLAAQAARDVTAFDQQGCVSPHVFFIEQDGAVSPRGFSELLAAALVDLSVEIPRGTIDPADSATIHQLRAEAEMRGAAVWSSEGGTEWTVIYEDRPEFDLSPLNRVILVRGVASLFN